MRERKKRIQEGRKKRLTLRRRSVNEGCGGGKKRKEEREKENRNLETKTERERQGRGGVGGKKKETKRKHQKACKGEIEGETIWCIAAVCLVKAAIFAEGRDETGRVEREASTLFDGTLKGGRRMMLRGCGCGGSSAYP